MTSTHADQHLRILGFRQRIVERSLLHVLHQQLHVRLNERMDEAAEKDLHAQERQQVRFLPAVELGRVRIDE